jgi:hypothetical protein
VGEHGVGRHHRPAQRQHAEQPQGRLVLVGAGGDGHLGDDGGRLRGVGGQQVDAGQVPVPAAADHLPVEGDVVVPVRVAVGQPVADEAVQVVGVEGGEQVGEGVGTRHLAVAEAEGVPESVPAEAAELGDGGQAGVPGEGGDEGEGDERHERVRAAFRVSRVGQLGQAVEQGWNGHRPPPGEMPEDIPTSPTFTNPIR